MCKHLYCTYLNKGCGQSVQPDIIDLRKLFTIKSRAFGEHDWLHGDHANHSHEQHSDVYERNAGDDIFSNRMLRIRCRIKTNK